MAFVTGEYPKPSETFVLRELRGLRRRGLDFVIVAMRRLDDIPEAGGIDVPVLLRPPLVSLRSLKAGFRFLFTRPLRCAAVVAALSVAHVRRPGELVRVVLNVPRALAVAYDLVRLGVTRVHALWASFPATLGWVIARALDVDFSFSAHARDVFVEGRMLRAKTQLARHVIVCNRAAADRLTDVVGDDATRKIRLVHHGIDTESLPARSATPDDTVLAAGRFVPKKGFDVLIRACAVLAARGRDVHCVIVGDGPQKASLERLIAETGVRGVTLVPWMTHDALMARVARAAVVAAPSVAAADGDRDGIPNIVLEAMAIGTPVVASDAGGAAEVVTDGETGLVTRADNPATLADKIGRILDKTGQTGDITGRANELIRRKLTLRDTLDTLHGLLTD